MKRILTVLLAVCLVFALAVPAFAEGETEATPVPSPSPSAAPAAPARSDVAVVSYAVTNVAGGEVTTVNKGDHINVVLQIADYSAYGAKDVDGNDITADTINARFNTTDFTYTGIGEVGRLVAESDYLSYTLLFRDVVYNGTSQTLPINLSYNRTTLPFQTISLTLGQCVLADKENAKTPSLMVRTSGYGEVVTAGEEFTLSLGIYATDGNENLNDVIVTLNLPENVSLSGGSLTQYVGTLAPKTTKNLNFNVLPSAGFAGTVADISVTLTGTGADSGTAANATPFTVSVPVVGKNTNG